MNEKINITKSDGAIVNADIVCFIENTNTSKRYVYYTLNEIVGAGANSTVKIYVSKVKQDNPTLDVPISEEEWGLLKGYMGNALKAVASPEVKYVPLGELGSPVSISERAIAMPTSYDYINKQRGIYAQAVATEDVSTESPAATPAVETPTPAAPEAPVVPEPTVATPAPEPVVVQQPATVAVPTEPVPSSTEPVIPAVEALPVEQPIVPEPAPVTPEPVAPVEPVAPSAPVVETTEEGGEEGTGAQLQPIDISTIEAKYAEMLDTLNKLKNQEIEAAKRYNATLELSSMHKEQHANYVQNEQIKEASAEASVTPVEPAPVTPAPEVAQPPIVEPVPVAPVEPTVQAAAPIEPAAPTPAAPQDLETNWFDMPSN